MQVQAKAFGDALATVGRLLLDKSCNVDYRGCVRVVAFKSALWVDSSDIKHHIAIMVHANGGPEEPESMVVPWRALSGVLSGHAKQKASVMLTMSDTAGQRPLLRIERTTIAGRMGVTLPSMAPDAPTRIGVVEPAVLRRALQQVLPALNPKNPMRDYRNIVWENGEVLATDGRRLHRSSAPIVGGQFPWQVLIDDVMAQMIVRALPSVLPVTVFAGSSDGEAPYIHLVSRTAKLTMRVTTSPFPDWRRVAEGSTVGVVAIVGRDELLEAIEGAGARSHPSVLITTNGAHLDVIVVDDIVRHEARVTLHSRSLPIGRGARVDGKYLYDALASTSSALVQLTFSGPASPMQLAATKGFGTQHTIMTLATFTPTFCEIGLANETPARILDAAWCQAELLTSTDEGDRQWLERRSTDLSRNPTGDAE